MQRIYPFLRRNFKKEAELTVDEIIEGCKTSDNLARRELYERYSGLIYGILRRYVNDRSTAEDLLHDVFVTIFTKIGDFSGRGSFEGWCSRIAVNTALNYFRRTSPMQDSVAVEDVRTLTSTEESAISRMSAEELLDAMSQLPQGFRTVLNLYAVEGYSHKEIAEMLGITEATSRSQYWRARNRLLELLGRDGYVGKKQKKDI